jgi:hypothetical protein
LGPESNIVLGRDAAKNSLPRKRRKVIVRPSPVPGGGRLAEVARSPSQRQKAPAFGGLVGGFGVAMYLGLGQGEFATLGLAEAGGFFLGLDFPE